MPAELIRGGPDPFPEKALDAVAGALRAGAVVGLPTETVYGLAARADEPEALARLREIKGSPQERAFTVHLPEAAWASRHAAPPMRPALRLMERYWPGPLTIVLPARAGGFVGLRVPARAVTREILRRADAPVVVSSANRAGEEPALEAEEVHRMFRGSIAAVVDGGRCELGQSSTVVRVAPGAFEVLREGILTREDLRRTAGRRVLLVCTGNTCRSPMAEGLLRRAIAERLGGKEDALAAFGYDVSSAGLVAWGGAPPSAHAVAVMGEAGLDISGHRTRAVTAAMIRESDLVLAMSHSHLALVREMAPDCGHKTRLLDAEGGDVIDPFGGSKDDYRRCLEGIRRGVEAVVAEL